MRKMTPLDMVYRTSAQKVNKQPGGFDRNQGLSPKVSSYDQNQDMMYGQPQPFNNENKIIDKMMEMDPVGGRDVDGQSMQIEPRLSPPKDYHSDYRQPNEPIQLRRDPSQES